VTFTQDARGKRKRAGEAADLSTFLPQREEEEEKEGEEEEGEEEGGQPEWLDEEEGGVEEDAALLNSVLFQSFDTHVTKLDAARLKRIEALSFKSALEDDGEGEINEGASLDEIEGLGVWQPGDEFQGDVNYRTLQKLLTRVDQRGFERYAHANPLRFSHALRTASLRCFGLSLAFAAAALSGLRSSWSSTLPS
tara:strand:- start:1217 stop:1798 length:582 start_codon:yes stop_codon:yes gene_type:complete